MTRSSVPLFSSTISSAMRRSVRSNARASSTTDCFCAAAMVRAIWTIQTSNGSAHPAHARASRIGLDQALHGTTNDRVARARNGLESRAIDHRDATAPHLDEPTLLQAAERLGHAR